MPTIQDIDRAEAARLAAARGPLIAALTAATAGKPWHFVLFGSMARGTPRRGSDADIAVVGVVARADWFEAEYAVYDICAELKLKADVMDWDDLAPFIQEEISREGIRCDA